MTTSPTELRIFVSHSSKDNLFGFRLAEDLRRVLGNETSVWYDVHGGLHGGDTWWTKIVEEITARNVFLLVISPDAMDSPWVNDEINLAWRQKNSSSKMRIIPVVYRECADVRKDVMSLQLTSFLPPKTYEDAFRELLEAMGLSYAPGPGKSLNEPGYQPTSIISKMIGEIGSAYVDQDWPAVIRKVKLLSKRDPDAVSATIYHMQAVALREEEDQGGAQEAFENALALVIDKGERLTILRDTADFLSSQGKWNEVLRLANEALRLQPNDATWKLTKEQAQAKGTLPKMPEQPVIKPQSNKTPDPPLTAVSKSTSKTKDQWLEEGNDLYNTAKYEDAIVAYTRSLEFDPNYVPALYNRGESYRMIGEYQKALVDCNLAIRLDSKHVMALTTRGDVYHRLGDYEKGIADCTRALELDPKYAFAYRSRGESYRLSGDYQRAIADCDKAIELDPTQIAPYYNRGEAYRRLGNHQKAIEDCNKAIAMDPKYRLAYGTRGDVYRTMGEYQKSLADCNRAIELDPNYTWCFGVRGLTYYGMKDYQNALNDFNTALKFDPSLTWFLTEKNDCLRKLNKK